MHRRTTFAFAAAVALAAVVPALPAAAAAGGVKITPITVGDDPFSLTCPVLVGADQVAFTDQQTVSVGRPGAVQPVLTAADLGADAFDRVVLTDDAGGVVVHALGTAEQVVLRAADGTVTTVAQADAPDFTARPVAAAAGRVAYVETLDATFAQGLFLWQDGVAQPVILGDAGPVSVGGAVALNDVGTLAVQGFAADGSRQVYVDDGGVFTQVTAPGVDLSILTLAGLTNDGAVLFSGFVNGLSGLHSLKDGVLTTLVDPTGTFDFVDRELADPTGGVALSAFYDGFLGQGIFTGTDLRRDKILAVGDHLFGAKVAGLNLCDLDAGTVTIAGQLDDGRGFTAVAETH